MSDDSSAESDSLATVAAPLRADGRVTLPVRMRKNLELSTGDYVVLVVSPLSEAAND